MVQWISSVKLQIVKTIALIFKYYISIEPPEIRKFVILQSFFWHIHPLATQIFGCTALLFSNFCLFMTLFHEFDGLEVWKLKIYYCRFQTLVLNSASYQNSRVELLHSRNLEACQFQLFIYVFFFTFGNAIGVYLGPCQTMELFKKAIEVALSGLRQFLATESPLKMN